MAPHLHETVQDRKGSTQTAPNGPTKGMPALSLYLTVHSFLWGLLP